MRRTLLACAVAGLTLALPSQARGQGDAEVEAAIQRAVDYLKTRQEPNEGHFRDVWAEKDYRSGETALALLALLKSGVKPDAPEIQKGFDWLLAQPVQRIYEVSVAILALEARYTPEEDASIKDEEPLSTQIRKRFKKKAVARDRQWLANAVAFIVQHQHPGGLWRYPFFGEPDLSNSQFAILALKAADRMGVRVNPEVFLREATCIVGFQEPNGPEVPPFPVRAADSPIAGLLDKRVKRRQARKQSKARESRGTMTRGDPGDSAETGTQVRMKARGWGYRQNHAPRASMTAAGLAVLVVCKSELEGSSHYEKALAPQVDQALRDGAAWIASRFAVDRNPGADPDWLFYYLYTLERAGTLLAVNTFGTHDWYGEGARFILDKQEGDGRFFADSSGQKDGDLAGTCFAVLFLKRSTVPLAKRPMTGGDTGMPPAGKVVGGPLVSKREDGQLDVTFVFHSTPGKRVNVAGSFNGWSQDAHALQDSDGDGVYEATITVPAGSHQYKFVVDGSEWLQDPQNPNGAPDGHGGENSVVQS